MKIITKLTWNAQRKKYDKQPVDLSGKLIDATDPKNWMWPEQAVNCVTALNTTVDGVQLKYATATPLDSDPQLVCIDCDHALVDGKWSDIVNHLFTALPNAWFETSVSGDGCHFFFKCENIPEHACKNIGLGIELYHDKRFIVDGVYISGSKDTVLDITQVVDAFFPPVSAQDQAWTTAPVEEYTGPKDDDELLNAAFKAKSAKAMLGGVSFDDLWNNNKEALADEYPAEDRDYDASSADAALALHLAFWTGKNCERMKRLMLRSSLVREKWSKHKSYLEKTILKACAVCRSVYNKSRNDTTPEVTDSIISRKDSGFCTADDQRTFFKGCVYISDLHRILTPNGALMDPQRFNAYYGGFIFVMDDDGKTTKKAFECLTESRANAFPKVDQSSFTPDAPFQSITVKDEISRVNVYKPFMGPMNTQSPEPFLIHLRKLLPNTHDQRVLLGWMAAVVQYRGKKIFWAPVIQGAQGNGKTLFTDVLKNIVGKEYTHLPQASDLENKFNGWLRHKILIGIEDIYIPESKLSVMEALKPMITGQSIEIQAKGMDQRTEDVCANFILNTNYKDALLKTDEDRRYAIFYTAQQTAQDIINDGMGGDYFPNLYNWLRADGYGAVNNYLMHYKIEDELNPMIGAHRAPRTSSTEEAIQSSMNPIAQDIIEMIHEDRCGFSGGWISFPAVRKSLNRRVSPRKLHEIIELMGYSVPKALGNDQRTNSPTITDGVKSKLFLKNGHPMHECRSNSDLMAEYDRAQAAPLQERLPTTNV